MKPMRCAFAALICLATAGRVAAASDTSCEYSVTKKVKFSSGAASDRLTISIGSGPCYEAQLTLVVEDARRRVLYNYSAPFKRHTAMQWDDASLPAEARSVVDYMLGHAVVEAKDVPLPDPTGQVVEAGAANALVPAEVLRRLLESGQPVLMHPTHYEAWQYVMFDPVEKAAKVIVRYEI